jgi:hypothetical protein
VHRIAAQDVGNAKKTALRNVQACSAQENDSDGACVEKMAEADGARKWSEVVGIVIGFMCHWQHTPHGFSLGS